MADFIGRDLRGSRIERTTLSGSRFRGVDLTHTDWRGVNLTGTRIRGGELCDVEIDGELLHVTVNGVDIAPLVEAELDRRHPDRAKMRPQDAAGFREAWEILERLWAASVDRARGFDRELLHESVAEEWSFIETLRHLVFATDSWVNRALLGDPAPWDPLDLPFDEMEPVPGIPWDRAVRPTLDEVLEVRYDRQAVVRRVLADLTDTRLGEHTEPVGERGEWPPPDSYPVAECLGIVVNEEWQHRLYAERDLDALAARVAGKD